MKKAFMVGIAYIVLCVIAAHYAYRFGYENMVIVQPPRIDTPVVVEIIRPITGEIPDTICSQSRGIAAPTEDGKVATCFTASTGAITTIY